MARRRSRRKKYQMGGRMCGGPGQPACNGRSGYRRGGRVNSRRRGRRFQAGGHTHHIDSSGMDHASRASNMHTHTSLGTGAGAGPNYIGNGWNEWEAVQQYQTQGPHRHTSGVGSVPQRRRGGRINYRLQNGGIANGASDRRTKTQKYDNKGRKR